MCSIRCHYTRAGQKPPLTLRSHGHLEWKKITVSTAPSHWSLAVAMAKMLHSMGRLWVRRRVAARPLSERRCLVRSCASPRGPNETSSLYLHPTVSLQIGRSITGTNNGYKREGKDVHGVVSICSPVKIAFAPAIKHITCCDSSKVCRPAARRMIVVGSTIRAVAMVRRSVW